MSAPLKTARFLFMLQRKSLLYIKKLLNHNILQFWMIIYLNHGNSWVVEFFLGCGGTAA